MATGDEIVVLTSEVDGRMSDADRAPIWEKVITSSHDVDDEGPVTQALNLNGILQKIIVKIPATTTTGTTEQVTIKDNGDNTIFDSGEKAEDDTYFYNVHEPLSGTIDVTIEPSAAAGAGGQTITVTLRGV